MPVPLQPPLVPALSPTLGVRLSMNAYERVRFCAAQRGMSMSEVMRGLVKTAWAVHFDGQNIDIPLGTHVPLAAGLPGANGAYDMSELQKVQG
jgi:hypothetical protein